MKIFKTASFSTPKRKPVLFQHNPLGIIKEQKQFNKLQIHAKNKTHYHNVLEKSKS
jgi:hypothetical protein